ncbi:protein ACCELERATED CELL DEATH 6 [Aegilops tauschii subsp. strangulata]|nr:ankyrin repeat-containing protein NPR4 [Aegilops tauschii subsp. strangulata]
MTDNTSAASSSEGGHEEPQMDRRLLKAAASGDSTSMEEMASQDQSILLGKTLQGNTCLHISSIHGHQVFCTDVVALEESLLATVNLDGETPLLTAITRGWVSLTSVLLRCYRSLRLSEAILQQDTHGCNALHHAIRSGHRELALELIAAEPDLSKHVTKFNDSPMYIAAKRNFTDVFEELLNVPDSSHAGRCDNNALHAAATNGNGDIATKIMRMRPEMARAANKYGNTPARLVVLYNKVDMLRVLLEHDCSLGYEMSTKGFPLLHAAAYRGHIDVAGEILKHCPDAPYCQVDNQDGWTLLHTTITNNHAEFTEFILRTPQLRKVINMQDNQGKTPLHYAVQSCNPKIVAALLSHEDIDVTMIDNNGDPATWELWKVIQNAKTYNEVCMLMLKANPQHTGSIYNLHRKAKQEATNASRKDAKSLTQIYTTNTSLVAILITTIAFAAAFTLPGGYSNGAGSEGLPVMSRKVAFQAFLISDTLAMCSSFAVAFICIMARWEDYEFLVYYRSFTKKLMWFAYVATTTAFSTGLYTVLPPHLHWLAIAICITVALLPILTKLLGEWPVLSLRFRLGKTFNSDLLDIV